MLHLEKYATSLGRYRSKINGLHYNLRQRKSEDETVIILAQVCGVVGISDDSLFTDSI